MTRLGSIVLYRLLPVEIERLGRATSSRGVGHGHEAGEQVPMIVTRDWAPSDFVNGTLVLEVDVSMRVVNVGAGPGPGQWQAQEA